MTGQTNTQKPTKWIWRPQAGPQKALIDCPFEEVFFGGARGGGKTDGVLGKWALKERRYKEHFNAIMFRRTTVSSEDAIERAKEIYTPLGAKFNASKYTFRMPNGGKVGFAYLDNTRDAEEYQGRNVTDAWVEEAGQYPDSTPIDRLFGVLRSAHGVPIQLLLTANPGGAGQHWIRERFKLHPFPKGPQIVERSRSNGSVAKMAVIPSRIQDNKILLDSDPGYIDRLHDVGGSALVRAWLEGDWSAVEGAFFDEWSEARHVLTPFQIPEDWTRFRSGDWGSAKPFSFGWWTVVGDAVQHDGRTIPRGALIRYREWYGCEKGKPNVGLKMTAKDVADGILERDDPDERFSYSVLDPSAFAEDGGPSIAERMFGRGVAFRRADNKRVSRLGALGGWDMMRQRLQFKHDEPPMIYCFNTCSASIRTIPVLQHDEARPEDLDTDMEDHAADEWRYACMSRPYHRRKTKAEEKPRTLQNATLNDMWEMHKQTQISERI